MSTGETTYAEKRAAWEADVATYFREQGFPDSDIRLGMAWGLDWLERCTATTAEQVKAADGELTLTEEQVGQIVHDAWHDAYTTISPEIDREGRRFPTLTANDEGLVLPTVVGVATKTFRLGYGTGLEDADRALDLMHTCIRNRNQNLGRHAVLSRHSSDRWLS